MPARTVKARAEKKRIIMAEPTTDKPKKVGVLKIPVHISKGPQRLPKEESAYLHKARSVEAPLTKMQVYAITAFRRGVGLAEIAKSSGLPSITLIKTLETVGLSRETHKLELDELATYFNNRRNP
jgi:chromosome segregation and condensation protein ScpB